MPNKINLDLYEEFKSEYVKPRQPVFVAVGPAKYLSITRQGAPGGEQVRSHISAFYSLAFTRKMAEKHVGHLYKVGHLEGQRWADGGSDFRMHPAKQWRWAPADSRARIHPAEGSGRCHTDRDRKKENWCSPPKSN